MHGMIFSVAQHPYISRSLGAHRIAHFLREQGWDIEVIDWANWWNQDDLRALAESRINDRTVFLGFSHLFNIWHDNLEDFGRWTKQRWPHLRLISGSAVNPMFDSECIDYYIQGFGELAIMELLRWIQGAGPRPRFRIPKPGGLNVIDAIHSYPAFPMVSLMVRYEPRDFIEPGEWLTIETSRGCVFQCAFCNFPVLGVRDDHSRAAEDFRTQLEDAYYRWGVSNYILADETFNDRPDKIRRFADVVERLPFQTWFSGYIRADLMSSRANEIEHLARMNLRGHYYGIESFRAATARVVGKARDPEIIKQGLMDCKRYMEKSGLGQYRGTIGLIAGLPGETENDISDTVDWLDQNWIGQSYSLRPLVIPRNNDINKPSRISEDLNAWGYREMSPQDIASHDRDPSSEHDLVRDQIIWESDDWNWFRAREVCDQTVKAKRGLDYRPNCHRISYRLENNPDLEQRLSMSHDEFDHKLDHDLARYIARKLSL